MHLLIIKYLNPHFRTAQKSGAFLAGYKLALPLLISFGVLLGGGKLSCEPVAEGVFIEPAPDWVESREGYQIGESSPYAEGGVFYHRLEDHFRPDEDAVFSRVVYELQSRSGLEDNSTLAWNIDPEFQTLRLHWIGVQRDGEWIDLLPNVEVEVVDARTDVRSWFYDNSKDVRIILEGVEVGDVLDYGFTRVGSNPVVDDYYSGSASLGFTVPVGSIQVRLDWPVDEEGLKYRTYPEVFEPEIREEDGFQVFEWKIEGVDRIVLDYDVPVDFEIFPWVQFSNWPDWRSVALWAAELYPTDAELPPLLAREANRIRESGGSPAEQATKALQFVQDVIRYVSIPVGPHSYQPYPPAKITERKYGDCKDKSLLLVLLLEELGIAADPVLVSTDDKRLLIARLPAENVFDHVLVRADINGQIVWMDPTDSHQGGIIPERYFPDYGFGLVVSNETENLAEDVGPLAAENASQKTIETFLITKFEAPVEFKVVSEYRGLEADGARWDLAVDGLDSFSRAYTNYYATVYDLIPEAEPLEVTDDRTENLLTITERYRMPGLFAPTEENGESIRNFPAEIIRDQIPVPSEKIRSSPFALYRPLHQIQVIEIHLPDESEFEEERFELENDWFRYDFSVDQEGRVLRIQHEFEILGNFVPVDRINEYLKEVDRVEEYLDYRIEVDHGATAGEPGVGFLAALHSAFAQPPVEAVEDGEMDEESREAVDGSVRKGISVPVVLGIAAGSFFLGILYSSLLLKRRSLR